MSLDTFGFNSTHPSDAETDNWHGIDLTRRGRTAKKKSKGVMCITARFKAFIFAARFTPGEVEQTQQQFAK